MTKKHRYFDVRDPTGLTHRVLITELGGVDGPSIYNIGHQLPREERPALQRAVALALMHGTRLPDDYYAQEVV